MAPLASNGGYMLRLRTALVGAGALLAAGITASAAQAATGWLNSSTSLRAGPGGQYPSVAFMRRGEQVAVFGCVRGYSYCDIAWHGLRGWARGSAIEITYQSRRWPIYRYAPVIGIPFVTFSIGTYWDRHYHNRPWFNDAWRYGGPRWDRNRDRDRDRDHDRDRDRDRNRDRDHDRDRNNSNNTIRAPQTGNNNPPHVAPPPRRDNDGRRNNNDNDHRRSFSRPSGGQNAGSDNHRSGPPRVIRNDSGSQRHMSAPSNRNSGNSGASNRRGNSNDGGKCRGPRCGND
jgi:uncharacterized protein YraI